MGKPVASELVADDFVGHWANREITGPDELQAIVGETQQMFSGLILDGDFRRLIPCTPNPTFGPTNASRSRR